MADDPTEALPVVKVELASARWTVSQFNERFAALTPVRARRVDGVDRGEAKILHDDMGEAIRERDRALQSATDGGVRLKSDRAHLRTMLRERDEQIARMRGETPGMGGLPTRAISEVMGVTRNGEQGAEVILADARRKAGLIEANARQREERAQELLTRAEETAAAGPPELVLPDEPRRQVDVLADAEAKAEWVRACREALAEHRQALVDYQSLVARQLAEVDDHQREVDEREQALGATGDRVLAALDEHAVETSETRAKVASMIDLTDGSDAGAEESVSETADVA
jgi:hypothetical protein